MMRIHRIHSAQEKQAMTQLQDHPTAPVDTITSDHLRTLRPTSPPRLAARLAVRRRHRVRRREPAPSPRAQRGRLPLRDLAGRPPHDLLVDPAPRPRPALPPPASRGDARLPDARHGRGGRVDGRADRHRARDHHRGVRRPDDRSRRHGGARVRRHGRGQRAPRRRLPRRHDRPRAGGQQGQAPAAVGGAVAHRRRRRAARHHERHGSRRRCRHHHRDGRSTGSRWPRSPSRPRATSHRSPKPDLRTTG